MPKEPEPIISNLPEGEEGVEGIGGGGVNDEKTIPDPWKIIGGVGAIWPEAYIYDWTEVGLIVKGPEDYEP